ncbi:MULTISPECIES: NADH:flavin oxidoreductase/NADH oxidase [Nitrosomonas]|uniref:2,4-dienoyl-CoA reductase-like NADH-dependent reductase (Old Yellow Enzyme family) n=1 Tax=Nitrosomonas communis TaxID=44574 RepID=A0A5D3YA74_9PROT|nr:MULTISPECIES: NADH:flavin oxidoreductase/NADH oxidase [Nitrosomonas]TYP78324.1 2,4-dienoyl-CoA reductase-like NADH-dependent reductase (Old Yellow Enzyme family) [Nitrosomonas communis]UVS60293.1 NADH:flavin oxidoreductase/NADH oxidase [Nitrosomonas sp. PLL12]
MSHNDENKHNIDGTPDPLSKTSLTANTTAEVTTAAPVSDRRLSNAAIQTQCQSEHDREIPEEDLMSPLTLRGVTFRNRIAISPMCMYSAHDGFANDFHLVHLGSRAMGGVGLVVVEATAVTAEGRITPGDMGIWKDEHIEPLARIARFVERQGAIPGIQLAHAGRKASCNVPWNGGSSLKTPAEGGWPVIGPSPLPFYPDDPVPNAMSETDIEHCVEAWETAARRALDAGFKVIELHAAHGYLMHEFLSPLSNHRTDNYGGSLANRMRLLLSVAKRLRDVIPSELPFFVRISATDWVDGGWDIEQSIILCRELKLLGTDLIDVSSGGVIPDARIPVARGYQVQFAQRVRNEAQVYTGGVGLITDPQYADEIITSGQADLVFIGRELLREPYWALKAQHTLGIEPEWPIQYSYAVKRRAK